MFPLLTNQKLHYFIFSSVTYDVLVASNNDVKVVET